MNVGVEYSTVSNSFQFKGAGAQVKLIIHTLRLNCWPVGNECESFLIMKVSFKIINLTSLRV